MTTPRTDIRALLAAGNVVLGPMAGITEAPFRGICKRMGAGLTYTEMVGAKALHYNPDSRISRSTSRLPGRATWVMRLARLTGRPNQSPARGRAGPRAAPARI